MSDFHPQRSRHISLCEALDRVLDIGVVALGEVTLSVADVDLIYLSLQLVVTSVEGGRGLPPASAAPQLVADLSGAPPPAPGLAAPANPAVRPPPAALGVKTPAGAGAISPAVAGSNREKNGLGRLVLTVMKLLHELLERQAVKRIDGGALTSAQIERLGVTLMQQAGQIDRLRKEFGLADEDLNLDLGPLGKLL